MKIGEVVRDGDFKAEKHVPTIEAPEKIKAGEEALVKVCVGKEIKHPNTPLHHISWIQLYFKPAEGPVVERGLRRARQLRDVQARQVRRAHRGQLLQRTRPLGVLEGHRSRISYETSA